MRVHLLLRTYALLTSIVPLTTSTKVDTKTRTADKDVQAKEVPSDQVDVFEIALDSATHDAPDDEETSGHILLPYFITTLIPPSNASRVVGNGKAKQELPPPAYLCQQYPDYFSRVNTKLDTSLPVNLTCWTTAPAADKVSACVDHGAAWFRSEHGCWIPDYIIETLVKVAGSPKREALEELTDVLRYCPPPLHQVASVRNRYKGGTYCYLEPSLAASAFPVGPGNGSVELDCWATGEPVQGDDVWWKWKNSNCLIPNQIFDPFSFYGNAHECRSYY